MSQGLTGAVSGAAARATSTESASTVTLPAAPLVATYPISGTTTITSITAGAAGRIAVLEFVSATCQVTNGSNLKLASNYISTVLGTLTLESDGTNWVEMGRTPPRLVTAANLVVAGPSSGAAVMETARALVIADLPTITQIGFAVGSTSGPTTTSGSFVVVPELTFTLTTAACTLEAWFAVPVQNSTRGAGISAALALDGVATQVAEIFAPVAAEPVMLCGHFRWASVAAGSHTVDVRWAVGTGTATAYLTVRELLVQEVRV